MPSIRRSIQRGRRPGWGRLYAVFPLAVVLLVAAHLSAPSPPEREVAEGLASLLIIGALALWVRANRLALASYDPDGEEGRTLRVSVVYTPPSGPATGTQFRQDRAQVNLATRPRTGDGDKENVTWYARSNPAMPL
jgi:hypothetical protein